MAPDDIRSRAASGRPIRGTTPLRALAALALLAGCGGDAKPAPEAESGWEVTVYYTAVESFHDGEAVEVTGCPKLDCDNGDDPLGAYPADFVEAVEAEGTGRITSGEHEGEYLNWSHGVGYWLDSQTRDSYGDALVPFVSAAADADVAARGSRITVIGCGDAADVTAKVCGTITGADWVITDEFTPGLGGDKHIDVYIGEEDGPDFTDGPWYTTLENAELRVHPPG